MNNKRQNKIEEILSNPELKEKLKKLVLERIKVMPDTLNMAIGSTQLTKEELEQRIKRGDEIGNQIMEIELEYLRDLASGAIYGRE